MCIICCHGFKVEYQEHKRMTADAVRTQPTAFFPLLVSVKGQFCRCRFLDKRHCPLQYQLGIVQHWTGLLSSAFSIDWLPCPMYCAVSRPSMYTLQNRFQWTAEYPIVGQLPRQSISGIWRSMGDLHDLCRSRTAIDGHLTQSVVAAMAIDGHASNSLWGDNGHR